MIRFWDKVDKSGACWEWTAAKNRKGYGVFVLTDPLRQVKAHRWAYADAAGIGLASLDGLVVRHRCDNPGCVNPAHLETGTVADNNRDRAERGRSAASAGELNSNAKITPEIVREMRTRRAAGETQRSIAESFGVKRQTVQKVLRAETWAHVQ